MVKESEILLLRSYFILAEAVGLNHPDTNACKDRLLHLFKACNRKLPPPYDVKTLRNNPEQFYVFAKKTNRERRVSAGLRILTDGPGLEPQDRTPQDGNDGSFDELFTPILSMRRSGGHRTPSPQNALDGRRRSAAQLGGVGITCSVLPGVTRFRAASYFVDPEREIRHSASQDFFKDRKHHLLWPKSADAGNMKLTSDPSDSKKVHREINKMLESGNYFQAAEFTRQAVPFNFADQDLERMFRLSIRQLSIYPKWRDFRINVDLKVHATAGATPSRGTMLCLVAGEPVNVSYKAMFKDPDTTSSQIGKDWIGIFRQPMKGARSVNGVSSVTGLARRKGIWVSLSVVFFGNYNHNNHTTAATSYRLH